MAKQSHDCFDCKISCDILPILSNNICITTYCIIDDYKIFTRIFGIVSFFLYIAPKIKLFMEQKEKVVDEQIAEIEQSICDFFALTYEDVFSKKMKRDLVLARHFMIYILHTHYGISANALSKIYNHSARHIKRICASIRNYIQFDKKYKNYYECLMVYIKREA